MKNKERTKHKNSTPPFGRTLERFSVKGLHPQLYARCPALLNESITKMPPQGRPPRKETTFEQLYKKIKALGEPTARESIQSSQQNKMKTKDKTKGLNWQLALNSELTSKIPCVLYLQTWELNKAKNETMGPTKYDIQEVKKSCYMPGVMDSKEPRFHSALHKLNAYPGPGTYGPKGIPYIQLGDSFRKKKYCSGKKTIMANTGRKPFLNPSYLAPNVYFRNTTPNTIQEYVERKVSLRGPYDLFSGDRQARVRTGWLPQTEVFDTKSGPINHLSTSARIGKNGTLIMAHMDRNAKPTGRFVCETNGHAWGVPLGPAPTYYNLDSDKRKCITNVKEVPFNRSSKRFDALNARRFFGDYDVCGPGRYEIKTTLIKESRNATLKEPREKQISKLKAVAKEKY